MILVKWGLLSTLVRQKCNSCYATVTTQLMEHQYKQPLSIQQIMDCTDFQCNGGTIEDTIQYIQNNPITTQKYYKNCNVKHGVKGEFQIMHNVPTYILKTILPVAVAIDPNNPCKYGNHMVTVIAMQNNHWIVQNSYGKNYGIFNTTCYIGTLVLKLKKIIIV